MVDSTKSVQANTIITDTIKQMEQFNRSQGKTGADQLARKLNEAKEALNSLKSTPGFKLPEGIKQKTADTLTLANQQQAATLVNAATAFQRLLQTFSNGQDAKSPSKKVTSKEPGQFGSNRG